MPDSNAAVGAEPGYTLLGPDGKPYRSAIPGVVGGHRAGKIYGRLDCPAALSAIARGGASGKKMRFTGITVLRLENGLIVEEKTSMTA